jgi:hypothetical protein
MPGNGIRVNIAGRLARTRFGREAMVEKADPSLLRTKPTPRVWLGLGLIVFSYIIGWPAVGILAWIAYSLHEPLIVVIGGPVTYGLSHLVFWVGSWLAGARYARIFLRWVTRKVIEMMGGVAPPSTS